MVLAILLVVAMVAGLAAVSQRDRAQDSATDARDAAVAADARRVGAQALVTEDSDRSLLLAAEGVRLDDSADTRANLLAALSRNPALVGSARGDDPLIAVDVSPDGRVVAAGGPAQGVSFRGTDGLDELGFVDEPPWRIRFRPPDGEQLVIAANVYSNEEVVELDPNPAPIVDTATFEQAPAQLGGWPQQSAAGDVRYSADGRFLAASFDIYGESEDASIAAQIVVWDLAKPEEPILRIDGPGLGEGPSYWVALSPDGSLLYTGTFPAGVDVYRVATGELLRSAAVPSDWLEISPDGTLLATADGNEIVLLDAATLSERAACGGTPRRRTGSGSRTTGPSSPRRRTTAAPSSGTPPPGPGVTRWLVTPERCGTPRSARTTPRSTRRRSTRCCSPGTWPAGTASCPGRRSPSPSPARRSRRSSITPCRTHPPAAPLPT